MGEKRYVRSVKRAERLAALEAAPARTEPSIQQRVAAFNADLLARADLDAIVPRASGTASDANATQGGERASTSAAPSIEGFPDATRVIFGNLPVDVAEEAVAAELGQLLEECMRQANIGSDSALDEVVVATFGPCRPKTRRDRDRLHRGFAVRTFASADAAAAIIAAAHGKTMKTTSPRGGERKINARLDEKNECDVAFCKGLRGSKPVVKEKVKATRKKWSMSELDKLPMRAKCLSTHTRFSDLDGPLRVRVLEYLSTAVSAMPELAGVVLRMEKSHPHFLRIKELVESIEAFNVIVAFLNSAESMGPKSVYDTFFDLACGHGLVGVMLAYAFPHRKVCSFDHARRSSFFAFAEAFAEMQNVRESWDSSRDIDWDCEEKFEAFNRLVAELPHENEHVAEEGVEAALPNLNFFLGDIEAAKALVTDKSFVIALHGCNEANKTSVEMAIHAKAVWCVMPCCIKANLYLAETVISKLSDDTRFAYLCGVMSHKYDAQMVRSIDSRITTRPIVLCGGIDGYRKHCFVFGNNTKIQREREVKKPRTK